MRLFNVHDVPSILEARSYLSGTLFQLIWNAVPTCLECEHHIAETRREVKKLCIRAYFGVCKYLSLSMFFDFPWRVKV